MRTETEIDYRPVVQLEGLSSKRCGDARGASAFDQSDKLDANSLESGVVIIEERLLVKDCLTRALELFIPGDVRAFSSIEAWLSVCEANPAGLVVLCSSGGQGALELDRVKRLASAPENTAPVMVMSDICDPNHVISVLAAGARGLLTTDVGIDVAIEAMRFVRAGGVFVPATSFISKKSAVTETATTDQSVFTNRQIAVIKALRQGKANKIIAYELNMCESTVKVHVRNIMKKLKARNRTHAAFIANEILADIGK
jgi:DNA-binding NarL/FixJ family response regulator